MEMIYAKDFEVGSIIKVEPIKSIMSEDISFDYGIILSSVGCKKIFIGSKGSAHDCYSCTTHQGEFLKINGTAKIRLYTGEIGGMSYKSDYSTLFIDIKDGILQLTEEDLKHFITILNVEEGLQLKLRDLVINDITLLSVEEAEDIPQKQREFWNFWWLRSPGTAPYSVMYVSCAGDIYKKGDLILTTDNSARPVLMTQNLSSFHLPLYSDVWLDNNTKWIVLSDNRLLCNDDSFGTYNFDPKSNDYDQSEIKQHIYKKAKELEFNTRRIERRRSWEEATPIPLDMFE